MAPRNVARVPKMISAKFSPDRIFAIKQPRLSPGIASGIKAAKMQRLSDSLNCINPDEIPRKVLSIVKTAYNAAIMPAFVRKLDLLFINCSCSFVLSEEGFELTGFILPQNLVCMVKYLYMVLKREKADSI